MATRTVGCLCSKASYSDHSFVVELSQPEIPSDNTADASSAAPCPTPDVLDPPSLPHKINVADGGLDGKDLNPCILTFKASSHLTVLATYIVDVFLFFWDSEYF